MNIGEKIRELRRKHDLTQEKLADYLCVSYQAVSKWETGVSSPDLAQIAPLTKLLHVTADELLCLNEPESDKRRIEIDTIYEQTWTTGDLNERLKLTGSAVREYPGDYKYLNWRASTLYFNAIENLREKEQETELERVIKICDTVIEGCTDNEIRNHSLLSIVMSLSWLYRYDEAKKYAELYPETDSLTKDDLLSFCLTGEEKIKHKQEMLLKSVEALDNCMYLSEDINTLKIAEQIIKLIIPDGNYLNFHGSLYHNYHGQARYHAINKQYDEAIGMLRKSYYHVNEYDRIAFKEQGLYRYTTPLFDRIEIDTREWGREVSGTVSDGFYERLNNPIFDPIRDKLDFIKN